MLYPVSTVYFSSCGDYLSNDVKEVGGGLDAAELGLNERDEFFGKDLDHRLRRQLVHGVVLVVSPGEVSELFPGELVDPLDHLRQVLLEGRVVEQDLELSELLVGDLALPLDVALAVNDHRPEVLVSVHPLLEGLREELGPGLPDVHGEDDEVEVPLDVVHDLVLEEDLCSNVRF